MLGTLLGNDVSLGPLKQLIAGKTEGNPLFMEEIVLSLFEDGTLARNGGVKLAKPLASLRIPPTVQGIIASRIDRLPADEKDLLQTVAVIGTEFNLGVTRVVCGISDDDGLNRILNDLQLAEFIYERPGASDIEYNFKHALTHDVAYNSLLTERRKLLHERTGYALEGHHSEQLDNYLPELAHHFDRGGNLSKAVEYLSRAGFRAAQQVANSEAMGYFTRSLKMLPGLPEGLARDRQELEIQMALSWSAFVAIGPRAAERESALLRARALCDQLGENSKLIETLVALAHLRVGKGDFRLAGEMAESVLEMAQRADDPAMMAGAHYVSGIALVATGHFPEARQHFERAAVFFGAGNKSNLVAYFSQVGPPLLDAVLSIVGYPSTSTERNRKRLKRAAAQIPSISRTFL